MLKSKIFINKLNGKLTQVIEEDEQTVLLSGGIKMNKNDFLFDYDIYNNENTIISEKKNNNVSEMTPEKFFNQSPVINNVVSKLSSIDTSKIRDDIDSGIIIKRKDGDNVISTTNISSEEKSKIIGDYINRQNVKQQVIEDDTQKFIPKENKQQPKQQINETMLNEENATNEYTNIENIDDNIFITPKEKDIFKFFSGFKKIYETDININVKEKIAEPEFLKLMSNNFDADVIKYYTIQILNNIYNDKQKMYNVIYKQIKECVFGKEKNNIDNDTNVENVKKTNNIKRTDTIKTL